jgi:hypothetical protein
MQAQSSSSAMLRVCFDPGSREATIAISPSSPPFLPSCQQTRPLSGFFPFPARGRSKEIYHFRGRLNFLNIVTAQADIKKSEVPAEVTVSLFFKPVIVFFPHNIWKVKKFPKKCH